MFECNTKRFSIFQCFFLPPPSRRCFRYGLTKVIFQRFMIHYLRRCDQDWTYYYDMPYTLVINSNGGFKRSCEILLSNYSKHSISATKIPMAIKPGRVVVCHEGLISIKSHDLLFTTSSQN